MIDSTKRLKQCNFKLNTLLNLTQAINENLSASGLLERFEYILSHDLKIGKIAFFKKASTQWETVLINGFDLASISKLNIEKDLLRYEEIVYISNSPNPGLKGGDIIIPVIVNNKPAAYVMIGDIDEDMEGISPTLKHMGFIQTLANIITVAIENIRLFNESLRQESFRKEMELASRMQTMLIPDNEILPQNNYVHVSAFYRPHYEIGGDYYDFLLLDEDRIGFCIADVSGKGISAALLMSNFQANLRALFTADIPLQDLIGILNSRIVVNTKQEKFITFFVARFNYRTHTLEYVNAGHNPPVLFDMTSNTMIFLNKGCTGIGMLEEIPIVKKGIIEISNHSKLLCYTDGLVELLDDNGQEYGTKSIENEISNTKGIEDNINEIIRSYNVVEGSVKLFDDITLLGIEFFEAIK